MTLRTRRMLIVAGILVVASLLAFPLRGAIYSTIVIPVAFLLWQLGLVYRSLPQHVWWWILFVAIFFVLVFSMVPPIRPAQREAPKPKPRRGQVEDFSIWLGRAKNGVYFKWLVANRLGKLAYQILLHRESGRPRSVFAPLVGEDWTPPKELQQYLETGLHGSFSDYSTSQGLLAPQQRTPLDYDVQEAVAFLESKVENDRTGRSGLHNAH